MGRRRRRRRGVGVGVGVGLGSAPSIAAMLRAALTLGLQRMCAQGGRDCGKAGAMAGGGKERGRSRNQRRCCVWPGWRRGPAEEERERRGGETFGGRGKEKVGLGGRAGMEWAMCPARLTPMSSHATTTRRPDSWRRACGHGTAVPRWGRKAQR